MWKGQEKRECINRKDGSKYIGDMKLIIDTNGEEVWIQNGEGVQKWEDGNQYSGNWVDGMMQGQG